MEKSAQLLAVVTKSTPRLKYNHHQSFKLWAVAAFLALSLAILVAWLLKRGAQKLINQQVKDLIRLRNQYRVMYQVIRSAPLWYRIEMIFLLVVRK